MNFYQRHIEPALINCACSVGSVQARRKQITPRASGTVLEVGFGSGHNLPFYDNDKVNKLFALEPSEGMRKRAAERLAQTPLDVELLDLPGERIPLDADSVDSILITYTMCTIPGIQDALGEMRRVLRPGGHMYFCEHGRAPDQKIARFQDKIDKPWGALFGGCHVNRNIPELLRGAEFNITELQEEYIEKAPKFAGYTYMGVASSA